ncbi:hypothetical protein LWM68_24315 [Niabella sp. W65]|nr:hypothetical protein [Niabella sp. W65]MCH7365624.1 hypothetical protein [Niabella sp. W65]
MLFSCSLKEFNPGGTTADVVFAAQEGMNALVNSAYVNYGGQFYGREDIVMLTEGGTDLWINIANSGYGRQMTKYEELTSGTDSSGIPGTVYMRLSTIVMQALSG